MKRVLDRATRLAANVILVAFAIWCVMFNTACVTLLARSLGASAFNQGAISVIVMLGIPWLVVRLVDHADSPVRP